MGRARAGATVVRASISMMEPEEMHFVQMQAEYSRRLEGQVSPVCRIVGTGECRRRLPSLQGTL